MATASCDVDDHSNLILKINDDKFQYVFKIRVKNLIFTSHESAEMPLNVNILEDSTMEKFLLENQTYIDSFIRRCNDGE